MKWTKKGLIWAPDENHPFGKTRVFCPTPFLIDQDTLRIYAGFCDEKGISRPGFVDVNPDNPREIKEISQTPLMEVGKDGTFDDNGLCPTTVIEVNGKLYMYYFGFQLGVKVPFYIFSGLAISTDDDDSWERHWKVPVLDRSNAEYLLRSAPNVIFDDNKFKIYYPCGNSFIDIDSKKVHQYKIRYMESKDGIHWGNEGKIVLDWKNEEEFGFGRPFVFKRGNTYRFIYSIRSRNKGYRLGYAESDDGINWQRMDEKMGIDVSSSGWDSEMLCYASHIKVKGKSFLFYNGNGLGATGFGYAELEEE